MAVEPLDDVPDGFDFIAPTAREWRKLRATLMQLTRMNVTAPLEIRWTGAQPTIGFHEQAQPLYGTVVCHGPTGQADYTDNRYWVQRTDQTNGVYDQSTTRMTFSEIAKKQPGYEIVTVENLFERNARTHNVKPGTVVYYRYAPDGNHHVADVMDEGPTGQTCNGSSSSSSSSSSGDQSSSSGHETSGGGSHGSGHGGGGGSGSASGTAVTGFASGSTGCGNCKPGPFTVHFSGFGNSPTMLAALNGSFTVYRTGTCFFAATLDSSGNELTTTDGLGNTVPGPNGHFVINVSCGLGPNGNPGWVITAAIIGGGNNVTINCTGGGPTNPSGAHGTAGDTNGEMVSGSVS